MEPVEAAKSPRLKREWIGRYVLTRIKMSNGWGEIAEGTRMKVEYHGGARPSGGGLTLVSATTCECCGLKARVSHVLECDVLLLPEMPPDASP